MLKTTGWRRRIELVALAALFAAVAGCGDDPKPASGRDAAPAAPSKPPVSDVTSTTGLSPAEPATAPRAPKTEASAPPKTETSASPTDLAPGTVIRWYEQRNQGQKTGWLRVTWAPSTWQGKTTVRDTTQQSTSTVRKMMDVEDSFTNESVTETERGEDGTLWWQRGVVKENNSRTATSETTWVGGAYEWTEAVGKDTKDHKRVELADPTFVDVEAMLSRKIASGSVKPGDRFTLRLLAVKHKGGIVEQPVEVLGSEKGPGPDGDVPCTKLKVTDPESGIEELWWIDAEGAVAKVKIEAVEITRVSASKARERPVQTAEYSITTPSVPALERIFSADRVLLDVFVRPDPDRPLPEFPTSPFSRVLSVGGDAKSGPVIHAELSAYDSPDAKATIPVTDPKFAPDLETNAMLACDHPTVKAAVARVVGDEKDARKAASKIAEFVFLTLRKQSNAVAEATAPEILRERKGDCSEHARLFVSMCRAAGIPARTCSGFVCIGAEWGAHAWAEIWTGAWIGVDPTTNDVGTAARYLLFGYEEAPDGKRGLVSSRASGRIRLVVRHLDEGEDHVDFAGPETWTTVDRTKGRAVHHLAGIDLRDLPADWEVSLDGDGHASIRVPHGSVEIEAIADQGYRTPNFLRGGARESQFAGVTAYRSSLGGRRAYLIPSRRRRVRVVVNGASDELDGIVATLEKVMAATLTPKPIAFPPSPPTPPASPAADAPPPAPPSGADGSAPPVEPREPEPHEVK